MKNNRILNFRLKVGMENAKGKVIKMKIKVAISGQITAVA